jgi:hypothetical protein
MIITDINLESMISWFLGEFFIFKSFFSYVRFLGTNYFLIAYLTTKTGHGAYVVTP